MPEDLERLSDKELHRKLLEHGFPNVPVTETTRALLIKKLKTQINNTKKAKRSTLNSSNKILTSSDERAQQNERNVSYEPRPTRATVAPAPLIQYADTSPNTRDYLFAGRPAIDRTYERPLLSMPATTGVKRPTTSPKIYVPPPIYAAESDEDSDYYNNYSANSNNVRKNVSLKSTFESNNLPSYSADQATHNPQFGVVSRLLRLRDSTLRKQPPLNQSIYNTNNESDIAHQRHRYRQNSGHNASAFRTIWSQLTARFNKLLSFKQIFIPHALVSLFAIFFILLAIMYVIKSPDLPNTIRENNTQFTICGSEDEPLTALSTVAHSCIESERLPSALEFNRQLIRLLQERAKQHHCVDQKHSAALNARDFVQHLYKSSSPNNMSQLLRNLKSAEYLIKQNPQWKIDIIENERSLGISADNMPVKLEHQFILLQPHLPLSCVLYNKMQHFFLLIGVCTLIGAVGLICYVAFRYIRNRRYERIAAVDRFTAEIIKELTYRASLMDATEERAVIINHLRDKLIPLSKRSSLLWSWNKSIQILERNDSRIQFGVTIHNGEEFRTIKWTGDILIAEPAQEQQRSGNKKQWQSPAFDNSNKINNPPTPCLKIRHMFDSTEINQPNLKQIIEESIIEKVGTRCNICDIQLDRQTCCVYVRCATEADAGIVHNEINGWWFDKRLVSIKFLRLERYLARFPTKSTAKPNNCLFTTNNSNVNWFAPQ